MKLVLKEGKEEELGIIENKIAILKNQRKTTKEVLRLIEREIVELITEKRELYTHQHEWVEMKHDTTNSTYWQCRRCSELKHR